VRIKRSALPEECVVDMSILSSQDSHSDSSRRKPVRLDSSHAGRHTSLGRSLPSCMPLGRSFRAPIVNI
jgi:hypothetical protein